MVGLLARLFDLKEIVSPSILACHVKPVVVALPFRVMS